MSSVTLDGEALARALRETIAADVTGLRTRGRLLSLATVTLGDDPATHSYMERKHRDAREVGIESRDIRLPANASEASLLGLIRDLGSDHAITGYSVQMPVPPHIDPQRIALACDPAKDADGKHPLNLGRLLWGFDAPRPCTAAGVLALLRHHRVPLAGSRVLLIGRGFFTGRPLMLMLTAPGVDAIVTVAHRAASDLRALLRESDVVISAAGVPDLVRARDLKPGAAIVGVGIRYIDGQMVSDVADDVAAVAGWVTPRHGSVGALTRAMLLRNTVLLAQAEAARA